jgi:hypothetical protein
MSFEEMESGGSRVTDGSGKVDGRDFGGSN